MAIAFDASSASGLDVASWNHTITGSNPVLIVAVFGQYLGSSGTLISAVKWNTNESLTAIHSEPYIEENGNQLGRWDNIYYLLNPTTGTHTISITSTADHFAGQAVSWTGVGALDTFGAAAFVGAATSGSLSLTVGTNAWIFSMGRGGTLSSWTNATARTTDNALGFDTADSNADVTGAQTTTVAYTATPTFGGSILGVSFTPSAGGGGTSTLPAYALMSMGVN